MERERKAESAQRVWEEARQQAQSEVDGRTAKNAEKRHKKKEKRKAAMAAEKAAKAAKRATDDGGGTHANANEGGSEANEADRRECTTTDPDCA